MSDETSERRDSDAFDEAAGRWADAQRGYAKFVARYWADERFRAQAQRDPAAALANAGIALPEGQRVKIVEVADDEALVPIPRSTRVFEAAESESYTFGTRGTFGTVGTFDGCLFTFACVACYGSSKPTIKAPAPEDPEPRAPEEGDGHPPAPEPRDTGGW